MIPRTQAAVQVGFDRGWHVGVQLAVWHKGTPALTFAQGVARSGVSMTDASLMPWFSGTKLVTATAIVQLWDRGLLELDQIVASVIPAFGAHGGKRAGYHPVTGFHVLGEIVRRITGRAFDAYVAEEIFEPLGMGDSWLALTSDRMRAYGDRVVVMHDTTSQAPTPLPRFSRQDGPCWVEPSSSGIGPMSDLVRLAEALRRGGELDGERIASVSAVEAMTARHRTNMRDETFGVVIDWGLGVMINSWHYEQKPTSYGYGDFAGRRAFGHGGMQSSLVFADPENALAVAFACNGMAGEPNNHRRTQPVISALYEDLGLA